MNTAALNSRDMYWNQPWLWICSIQLRRSSNHLLPTRSRVKSIPHPEVPLFLRA